MSTDQAAADSREPLPLGSRERLAQARLQLLRDTRRQLDLQLPRLDGELYASADELAELRRIAIEGRGAQIRIVLHDPAAALREDHRLIALIQRLPSVIQVRVPQDPQDLALTAACLLNDVGGYLRQPDAWAPDGHAARHDRAAQRPLRQQFEERWARAAPATQLSALGL